MTSWLLSASLLFLFQTLALDPFVYVQILIVLVSQYVSVYFAADVVALSPQDFFLTKYYITLQYYIILQYLFFVMHGPNSKGYIS